MGYRGPTQTLHVCLVYIPLAFDPIEDAMEVSLLRMQWRLAY